MSEKWLKWFSKYTDQQNKLAKKGLREIIAQTTIKACELEFVISLYFTTYCGQYTRENGEITKVPLSESSEDINHNILYSFEKTQKLEVKFPKTAEKTIIEVWNLDT